MKKVSLNRLGVVAALLVGSGIGSWAIVPDTSLVDMLHGRQLVHTDQAALLAMRPRDAYLEAFTRGDEIFSDQFNAADGGGANIGDGGRFTRFPRVDLVGTDQAGRLMWARHIPAPQTGPGTHNFAARHTQPTTDGGRAANPHANRDPRRPGNPAQLF